MGINWMHMLALYSNMGKKSTTHEEKCEIGTQLQKLGGKDRMVIDGINDKITELINRNNVALSAKDMTELKKSIVSEMGKIASGLKNKHSSPVTCNADSLIFDKDVKKMLGDLVRDKSRIFNKPEAVPLGEETIQQITDRVSDQVQSQFYMNQTVPDKFKGNLYTKTTEELMDYFFTGHPMFLIDEPRRYAYEAAENTSYVRKWGIMNDNRTIGKKQLLETISRFYENGKVPDDIAKQIRDFFNIKHRDSDGNIVYMYNDVELLRLVFTHIFMTKTTEDSED